MPNSWRTHFSRFLPATVAAWACIAIVVPVVADEELVRMCVRVGELQAGGDYAAATTLAEQALQLAERRFGPHAAETALPLGNLAALHRLQGNFEQAEQFSARGLQICEQTLGEDHPLTAIQAGNRGSLQEAQGRHDQAEQSYLRTIAILRKTVGRDHELTATYLHNLAGLRIRQSRFVEAEALEREALDIRERILGTDHASTATSVHGLAMIHKARGEYADAEPLYERALAIFEKTLGLDHVNTAQTLDNLAVLHVCQGQDSRAEPLIRRALEIKERALGPDHPDTVQTVNNAATIHERQGRFAEAERLYRRAATTSERTLGPDHPDMATMLNNLAGVCHEQFKIDEAATLYARALAIREKALGPDHPDTAQSLNNLAFFHDCQGQDALAEPLYRRALVAYEKSLGPDHPDTAPSRNNLAGVYYAQGQYALAEPLYKRSLAIREKSLGPDHPGTVQSLNNLAALEAARRRYPTAASLFDRARRGTRRHVARVLPALSGAEQAVFLRTQDASDFYGALTLGLLQKSTPDIARLSAGWLGNGKAVGQEAASQQIILARQSDNPATAGAVAALMRVRAELAKLSQMTPAADESAAYRAKLAELQAEEHRLVHEIGGQLAALDRDEPWIEIDAIRKNIPAGSVLVDIARFDILDFAAKGNENNWQPARYVAWVIPPASKGEITILDLGEADAIDALVARYRKGIEAVSGENGFARGHFTLENEMRATARPVTKAVLEPILAALDEAGLTPSEIILSPDGALWLLPWQALPLGDGEEAPYAIEQFAFRTVTSGRDLVPPPDDARPKTQSTRGPVVVADPAFDATPPAGTGSDKPAVPTRGLAPAGRRLPQVNRLAATLAEARASAAALQKIFSREPTTLTGTAASEENVKKEAVRPPALVLATHGYVLPDQEVKRDDSASLAGGGTNRCARPVTTTGEPIEDPLLRCGLLLAGANLTNAGKTLSGDDGILTGAEIVGLDLLGTDLVVLSACQTGEGQVNTGEGVAGLRQAFQIAGAQSVVATLWQVPDLESAQIMTGFYDNVARGSPPSKALREAQLAFIKARRADRNYESAHPFHWAAYGVTGR